jgi:hypothetical protein
MVGVAARSGSVDACSVAMLCVMVVVVVVKAVMMRASDGCGSRLEKTSSVKESGRVFAASYADANGSPKS